MNASLALTTSDYNFDLFIDLMGDGILSRAVTLLIVALIAVIVDRVVSRVLRHALDQSSIPSASIFVNLVRVVIWACALMSVLDPVFGIRPTAVVAALGVTSLVITLGMQDSVSNVIGGLGLMLGKVVQPGDKVQIADFRGTVTDVNWRSTTVLDRNGDEIVIPNSVLNTTELIRLHPKDATLVECAIIVRYDADLADVESQIVEASERGLVGHLVEGQPTDVTFTGADAYGFQCSVLLHVTPDMSSYQACDAFIRQIAGAKWLSRSDDILLD